MDVEDLIASMHVGREACELKALQVGPLSRSVVQVDWAADGALYLSIVDHYRLTFPRHSITIPKLRHINRYKGYLTFLHRPYHP